jgi:hypothetical protein
MKQIFYFLNACVVGFLLIAMDGCKKKEDNPIPQITGGNGQLSFVANGDGFTNKAFSSTTGATLAFYTVSDDKTAVGVDVGNQNSSTYAGFSLTFAGKSTGTFELDNTADEAYFILSIKDGTHDAAYYPAENAGTVTVTKYENVGGKIEGTFSGTLTKVDVTGQPATITIKDGKFSVPRLQDQN